MNETIGGGFGRRGQRGLGGGGLGLGGECKCPNCGYTEPHQRAVPCFNKKCPKCQTLMIRA